MRHRCRCASSSSYPACLDLLGYQNRRSSDIKENATQSKTMRYIISAHSKVIVQTSQLNLSCTASAISRWNMNSSPIFMVTFTVARIFSKVVNHCSVVMDLYILDRTDFFQ
ncbi:hypothetical protein ATANTOWER_032791 [Ataeniobius toweri]|uniref:Uncharacterized protein n=1 Tax=Ataeniobius toweri TaxID=208326 RepID=A0ABU7AIP8_9TELE|nr:hypothetical protein [Ataeniobius toweri]